ncbi:replication initiation protein RepC [Amaricoccus solimangrovi]|uniref:Uncharacterized protein n=1 Tax=Amaricoccus solimangrovi TaxID=2589815 RepID=A0A501WJW5_9RHOB|nr:replication initiation protein RepC [Amaricoccus solimangrovi]TPE47321.1 hypothetical protein FJM51_20290 [Amaricoccus solimangrovi]
MPDAISGAPSSHAGRYSHKELFRLLDDAVLALGLPDGVQRTAQVLIRFIPSDAPVPVSPIRVQDLAEQRDVDPRTVRAHIRRLIALGLVEDTSLGGGHRVIHRRSGRIVALRGIDFAPMLARADALRAEAAAIRLGQEERLRLRAEISALRHRFRKSAATACARILEAFAALPRRYGHLPGAALSALRDRLIQLVAAATPIECDEAVPGASPVEPPCPKPSDQSDEYRRPDLLEEGRKLVTPDLDVGAVADTLPPAWHAELARGGPWSWTGFIATAHARSIALGVPRATWDAAVATLGRHNAALLTLAAGAEHIRCPAAWMRALVSRAGEGSLDLSANLRSLISRRIRECSGSSLRC